MQLLTVDQMKLFTVDDEASHAVLNLSTGELLLVKEPYLPC